ncbi:MAG: membrane protease subunit HflC [Hyphomicrobiaceae bacterium]|jgi:modulator of FtsH protease HflC
MRAFMAFIMVLLILAGIGAYFSAFIVRETEQAIVLRFGKIENQINKPGLYFKIPIVETVDKFDKRILDLDTSPQEVIAVDKKRLVVDAFARFKIVNALKFYQAVRTEQTARNRLGTFVDSAIRDKLASASFEDIVRDKREELMKAITIQVNARAENIGIVVIDVRIKRTDLPEENSAAIYSRMQTERQQEAAEFRAEGNASANRIRAEADRKATVIIANANKKSETLRGEGDAERNRIFAEAYGKDRDFFAFYRSMQAYEKGLGSGDTRMLLSPQSEFFRYFNDPNGRGSGDKRKGQSATQ